MRNNHFRPSNEMFVDEETVLDEEVTIIEKEPVIGVVHNCKNLYVRTAAYKEATVEAIVEVGTELVIEMEESTEDFYKIILASGIEGFCMKRFIKIKS